MRDPSSLGDAIDLALDLPDWHRRHVVARAFLRAIPCIFSEPEPDTEQDNPVTQQHLLNLYRAGLLLAVAAQLGPVAADTESLERLRLPGEGARLDICISAKNAARSAVVTTDFSTERCSELCLADAFDAIAKYESENDLDLNITFRKDAADAMRGDINASSNPETLSVSNPLYSGLVVFPTMDRTFTGAGYPKVSSGRAAGPDFLSIKFWHDWYWGILAGKPLDWDLQRRVALIDDAIWEAGPEAVAQEIARIEAAFLAKPLDQDALRSHLTKLVETPLLFADSAESVSTLTTEAITRFKRDAETNKLPDGFTVFEQLPGVFGQISITLRSDRDIEEKTAALQDEVNRLNALVGQLRLDLAEARLALSDARLTALEARRTRFSGEQLKTALTNVTLLGAIGMTTLSFFGVEAKDVNYDSLKEALHGLTRDMEAVTPAPEPDTFPPSLDV